MSQVMKENSFLKYRLLSNDLQHWNIIFHFFVWFTFSDAKNSSSERFIILKMRLVQINHFSLKIGKRKNAFFAFALILTPPPTTNCFSYEHTWQTLWAIFQVNNKGLYGGSIGLDVFLLKIILFSIFVIFNTLS